MNSLIQIVAFSKTCCSILFFCQKSSAVPRISLTAWYDGTVVYLAHIFIMIMTWLTKDLEHVTSFDFQKNPRSAIGRSLFSYNYYERELTPLMIRNNQYSKYNLFGTLAILTLTTV